MNYLHLASRKDIVEAFIILLSKFMKNRFINIMT